MYYENKKILLMGLGGFAKGSGVSAAEFLASRGADLTITDLKTKKELAKNLAVLKKYKNIKYVLGKHHAKDFETVDWVIKNPDVPMDSPFLKIAQKRKIPIDNDITLFLREYGAENVIGVTGTRGKSTTASLIYEMARRQYPVARLGGNIGESPLRFLSCHPERHACRQAGSEGSLDTKNIKDFSACGLRMTNTAPVVLELSSFQLHNLDTIKISPHIAVWTNFYPDHLNKYSTLADYRKDKEKIFEYQKAGDVAVLNWDDPACHSRGSGNPDTLWFSLRQPVKNGAFIKNNWFVFCQNGRVTQVAPVSATKLLGEHNQANTLAAICASRAYGIKWPAIRAAIRAFKGVPNRLEVINVKGIINLSFPRNLSSSGIGERESRVRLTFVNDCTATSPEATIAALKSFPAGKIILISGGNSKGSSLKELAAVIAARARVLILVPGNANEELSHHVIPAMPLAYRQAGTGRQAKAGIQLLVSVVVAKNLKNAVLQATQFAKPGDTILFSPGLTWLPRQNEFARGEEFKEIVKNLIK